MAYFDEKAPYLMQKLMDDFPFNKLHAAAIVGNGGEESGGFLSLQEKKPLVPGSRGGYGIMQWTGPRRRAYEAYCKRNDLDPADLESNYKFLFVELKTTEKRTVPALVATKTLDEATEVFMKVFLRPGIPHLDVRKKYALRALQAYEKAAPGPGTPKDPEPTVEPSVSERKGIWGLILEIILILLGRR